MPHLVRPFGVWSITAPKGTQDKRIFLESRSGDWPLSLFQRAIGIKLLPTSVYRRSFARMGEWKGFFFGHLKRAPRKRVHALVREVSKNLGTPNAKFKLTCNAKRRMQAATGFAALWAPHIKLLANAPHAKLVARVYVKATPARDALYLPNDRS